MGYITVTTEIVDDVIARFGATEGTAKYVMQYDVNQDGRIDMLDLPYFMGQVGKTVRVPQFRGDNVIAKQMLTTTLTISAAKTTLAADEPLMVTASLRVDGSPILGETVRVLWTRPDGTSVSVTMSPPPTTQGDYYWVFKSSLAGTHRLQASFGGSLGLYASESTVLAVTVIGPPPPPEKVKTAELIVTYIRFPFTSDEAIINEFKSKYEGEFQQHGAEFRNPRIQQATLITQECTFDIYEPPPSSPSPLAPVVIAVILSICLGVTITLVIVLSIRVVSLEKTLGEVGKDIGAAIDEKKKALAAGKIDQAVADEIDAKLEEAKRKAEDAGVTDWWNMLEKIMGYMPLILIGLGALILLPAVAGLIPRRRD